MKRDAVEGIPFENPLYVPDFLCVLTNRTVGRELTGVGDIHQTLFGKGRIRCPGIPDRFQLRFIVAFKILHDKIVIRLVPGGSFQNGVMQFFQGTVFGG